MSDCRFGVSPVNYPDPDPDVLGERTDQTALMCRMRGLIRLH